MCLGVDVSGAIYREDYNFSKCGDICQIKNKNVQPTRKMSD